MNKLLLFILLLPFATSAQEPYDKATINFYPSFESSSSLKIDFKTSEVTFILDKVDQAKNFRISFEESKELKSVLIDLLNNSQPPIDTLETKDGKILILDGRLTEDGMTTYICLNETKEPAIGFGNSYSKSESELLIKLIKLIRYKISNNEYLNTIERYLN